MNKVIKTIVRMMAPSVLFLVLYKFLGLQLSVLISCAISFLFLLLNVFKEKKITNSAIIGALALAFQVVSAFCVGYEKLYYVPALVQNCVIMVLVLLLCIRSKSVFLYVVKDFDFKIFKNMGDEELLPLNYLWVAYCLLKIITKVVGMVALDFISMYWVVFLFGTPLNLVAIVLSYFYVKRKCELREENESGQ